MSVDRLKNITKLHTYYVSNAKTELKYVAQDMNNMNDDEFYYSVRSGVYQDIDDYIEEVENEDDKDEDKNNEDDLVDIEEYEKFSEENSNDLLQCENYFDLVSKEVVELLKLQEPRVIIELPATSAIEIDHEKKEFDLDSLLDQQLSNDD